MTHLEGWDHTVYESEAKAEDAVGAFLRAVGNH
jgi:hypothetical protein